MNSTVFVLALFVVGAGQAHACGPDTAREQHPDVDLGWIDSDLTIYGIDGDGLYEARPDSPQSKRLFDIGSTDNRGLAISPDGRFLAYSSGTGEDDALRIYHLYDLASGRDRVVPVLPQPDYEWGVEFLGFSPDSLSLVWLSDDGPLASGNDDARPELVVFSTENLVRRTLPYPAPAGSVVASRSCFTPQWSADGRAIYANYMAGKSCLHPAADARDLVYFRIELESGETTIVDGGYTFDPDDYYFRSHYLDDGVRLSPPYPCLFSHGCAAYGQELWAGKTRAWLHHVEDPDAEIQLVDGPEELYVQVADAPSRKVATGHTSSCAGSDIRLIDWINDGKYLLYHFRGDTYLYAVAENHSVVLPQLTGAFNWLPLATTSRLYYQMSDGNGDEKRYGPASAGD